MTVARDELMSKDFNPKFDALRNAIYHSSRRRFFELLNRSLSFLVVIFTFGGCFSPWGPLGNSRLHSGNECLKLGDLSRFLFRRIWSWIVTAPYFSPFDTAEAIPVRRELVFLRRA
jgi:hypothetical protein